MRSSKMLSAILAAVLLLSCLAACSGKQTPALSVDGLGVIHETEFGGVCLAIAIDDFNARGFEYGDSVTVTFSNGYTMEDLPYFNGYYVNVGEPLLVAYPGYDYIKAAINYGKDVWEFAGLDDGMTAAVTLKERGKYLNVQEASDIHYFDERGKYPSDAVFANFRAVNVGRLRENVLYRSASPCDNQHNRAPYVDALIRDAGVGFILNLADNTEKIEGYLSDPALEVPYFRSLWEAGQVEPIALNMNFGSDDFQHKLAAGLSVMTEHEGPYLVHCTEGKDRTGFVCMLLEALCGASYDEIVDDYMITYDNYYGITKEADAERYDTIVTYVLLPMVQVLSGDSDPASADLAAGAEQYLLDGGMTQSQITDLRSALTGK